MDNRYFWFLLPITISLVFVVFLILTMVDEKSTPEHECDLSRPRQSVLVGDELKECVEKGGEYRLYYSNVNEGYVSMCEVPEKELFRNTYD